MRRSGLDGKPEDSTLLSSDLMVIDGNEAASIVPDRKDALDEFAPEIASRIAADDAASSVPLPRFGAGLEKPLRVETTSPKSVWQRVITAGAVAATALAVATILVLPRLQKADVAPAPLAVDSRQERSPIPSPTPAEPVDRQPLPGVNTPPPQTNVTERAVPNTPPPAPATSTRPPPIDEPTAPSVPASPPPLSTIEATPSSPSPAPAFPAAPLSVSDDGNEGALARARRQTASDNSAIESVLEQYRAAASALDARAVLAVWPTSDRRELGRAFDQLVSQQLSFSGCTVNISGNRATATCQGETMYVQRIGDGRAQREAREWLFGLRKSHEQWSIEGLIAK